MNRRPPNTESIRSARLVTIEGRVQGVGFRPAVARLARQYRLDGVVLNTRGGVQIHLEGELAIINAFLDALPENMPTSAVIESIATCDATVVGYSEFEIRTNNRSASDLGDGNDRKLSTTIPTDVRACESCLSEVNQPGNRRFGYPFTTCTQCGPRYSIIRAMPFERSDTTMSTFRMCIQCHAEYVSAGDRRFHSQTNACPLCGPQYWVRDRNNRVLARGTDAIELLAKALRRGRIVAVKGLGGYQLLADATCEDAIRRLRDRKRRPSKPLAVMVDSLSSAESIALLSSVERDVLNSPEGPIVLLDRLPDAPVATSVAPGLTTSIGLMLPTTPLHWLLLTAAGRPVVCTSGNREGDPIVYEQSDALERLSPIADLWLEHDREISSPIDDSVVRIMAGRRTILRLARGYAPLPLDLTTRRPWVALGGQQKNAIALSNTHQAVLGPHIGNLSTVAARARFGDCVEKLQELFQMNNASLAGDQHPEYFTTEFLQSSQTQTIQVQHHHAHVAAGMLEHRWLQRRVLGVAFDGTGFGADETIWGGEFLLADACRFRRVASVRPIALAGGERAIREPWRIGVALVREAIGESAIEKFCFPRDAKTVAALLRSNTATVSASSAGRLFDGIASLILGTKFSHFEGHAAMLLESMCDQSAEGSYLFPLDGNQLDWRPLIRAIVADCDSGAGPQQIAMRFHRAVADAVIMVCQRYSELPVVLTGGVFQNRVLVELLKQRFCHVAQECAFAEMIPPNDGGLAAGQLAVAASVEKTKSCA